MDLEVHFELSGEDLARLRILSAADPLFELQNAAHRLARGVAVDAPAAGWARRTATALGPAGALIMDVLRSGMAMCSDFGQHSERFAVGFDNFADSIRRVPPRVWELEADELVRCGIAPGRPAGMGHDQARIAQFADVIERFQNAAVRPYWPAISANVAAHGDAFAQRLAIGGVDALLDNLHPSISWDDPILTIRNERGTICAPNCPHWSVDPEIRHAPPQSLEGRGLVLVPSVFAAGVGVMTPETTDADDRQWELVFPVPWDWSVSAGSHHQALTDLLGATRAIVLDCLLGRTLTTSDIARATHISPASASEHATVLRTAGLITSSRDGARVHHRLTSMGTGLATGGTGVTFTGGQVDQVVQ